MITRDSILRRVPANLNPSQALFVDGMRHAGEMATLAYTRLKQTLTQIAVGEHSGSDADHLFTAAFLDVWSLVDVIDRFRILWKLLPQSIHAPPAPGTKSFAELTQPIRDLRNVADHLAQRAPYVVACNGSALGVLSWFTALRPDGLEGVICTIVPGTLQPGLYLSINPIGHEIELPTGFVHLSAGEYRANLSAVIPEMAKCIKQLESAFERGLEQLAGEQSRLGADLLFKFRISSLTPPGAAPGAQSET